MNNKTILEMNRNWSLWEGLQREW